MENKHWRKDNEDGTITMKNLATGLEQTLVPHDFTHDFMAELNRQQAEIDSLERDGWQPVTAAAVPDDTFGTYDYEVPKRTRLILPWPINVARSRLEDFCANPGFVIYGGEQVPLPSHEPLPSDISKPFGLGGFRVELVPNGERTEVVLTNALGRGSVYSVNLLDWLGQNTANDKVNEIIRAIWRGDYKRAAGNEQPGTAETRPQERTIEGIVRVIEAREDNIKQKRQVPTWVRTCQDANIRPETAKQHHPELHQKWEDMNYRPDAEEWKTGVYEFYEF